MLDSIFAVVASLLLQLELAVCELKGNGVFESDKGLRNWPESVNFEITADIMTNKENLLTVKEFADRTNYSERTVRQWCIDGKIEAHKPTGGRKWEIPENEISRLLKRPRKRIFVTEDGIYEGEKIIDTPAWAKNVKPKTD